jgi:hypothetical protein
VSSLSSLGASSSVGALLLRELTLSILKKTIQGLVEKRVEVFHLLGIHAGRALNQQSSFCCVKGRLVSEMEIRAAGGSTGCSKSRVRVYKKRKRRGGSCDVTGRIIWLAVERDINHTFGEVEVSVDAIEGESDVFKFVEIVLEFMSNVDATILCQVPINER